MKPQPMSDAEIDAIWRDSSGRIISAADLKGVRAIIAARDAQWAAMIGEPVAELWQHSETGRTRIVTPDMIVTADATWLVVSPLYAIKETP